MVIVVVEVNTKVELTFFAIRPDGICIKPTPPKSVCEGRSVTVSSSEACECKEVTPVSAESTPRQTAET